MRSVARENVACNQSNCPPFACALPSFAMKARTTVTAGCLMLMFGAAAALAQGGDWQRVPSAPQGTAGAAGGMFGSFGGNSHLGCTLIARLAEDAAKARDKGISEQSQLKIVDDPNGTFQTLAAASRLPGSTTQALSATIRREVSYVYAHPEMTPAQVQTHIEQECEHPSAAGQ
jgi:hypothetical protein